MRKETDALGEMLLPDEVYYGIQTERNRQCLAITDDPLSAYPAFIKAVAQVKKACALTNKEIGLRRNGGRSRQSRISPVYFPGIGYPLQYGRQRSAGEPGQ